MPAPLLDERRKPYKTAGLVFLAIAALISGLVFHQFRGGFASTTQLTVVSPRAGLVLDEGSKVTYNGVHVGRVTGFDVVDIGGRPKAKITLDVESKYVHLIPANVHAEVTATTLFGNKYVAFSSPENPVPQRISASDVIDVSAVTTEFNTLFDTLLSIAEKVDPIKLNQTLAAAAEALDGLGDGFGQSLMHGNEILTDLNPQMSQIRYDTQRLGQLANVYADASPDLWDGLQNAVTTAQTLNEQQANLDQALMASIGVGNTGSEIFERSGPYLTRIIDDLVPTGEVLDRNSPALFCTIRNFHDIEPKFSEATGGNGYSATGIGGVLFAANPYVYPDNLPRVNARGGPEGRPGCWQKITRELWPAPYLVMDTGASIAPYNHIELGQPLMVEYVWGRQIGEYTINP